jgi:hypothetical protein
MATRDAWRVLKAQATIAMRDRLAILRDEASVYLDVQALGVEWVRSQRRGTGPH